MIILNPAWLHHLLACLVFISLAPVAGPAAAQEVELKVEQLTSGSKHHFFGYIGQCRTVPWNGTDRYILGMEIDRIDRMPRPEEAAVIILSPSTMAP